MASGTINFSSNNDKLAGKIEWYSTSNGSSANTSTVNASVYVKRTDGYTTKGTWTGEMQVAGTTQSFSHSATSVGSNWVLMKSFSVTVRHNDNGTGSCWISGYCNAPSGTSLAGANVNGGQTVTLDTIKRTATISSVSNFEHGSSTSINITNPSGASLNLVMKIGNTQIFSRTVTTATKTISFSDAELDNIYKLYGSGSSLTATFILTTAGTYTNTKICSITLKGNQKTIKENVNSSWRRGKVWVNVNGTWRRGIIWTNVNGIWKRGI